jgi:hypothetical protein
MSGVFIISFDCEGKWGVADHLDTRIEESFTTVNLLQNYRDLLALLGEHDLRATFAFVGAYTLSAEAFLDRRVEYEPLLSIRGAAYSRRRCSGGSSRGGSMWRSGGRRMVPAAVTVRRWTSLLRDAAKHDRVVHLWSHPHNFLTGDGMLPMFREIVRMAGAMCTRGDLVNMTQIDYAKRVKSLDAIAVTPSAESLRRRD